MSKFAVLHTGQRLVFPDDVTPEVMQAAVKKYIAGLTPAAEPQVPTAAEPQTPEGPQAPERTAAGTLGDIGTATLKGITAVPQAAIGLADIVSGGEAGKYVQGNVADLEGIQKELSKGYSPAQQAALKKVNEAKGFTGTLGALYEHPSVALSTLGESVPEMALMGGIGKAAKAAKLVESTAKAAGLSEGIVTAGSAAEQTREQSPDKLLSGKGALGALGAGAGTGLLGVFGSKLTTAMGGTDIETALIGGAKRQAVEANGEIAKSPGFFKRMLVSAFGEGALEELPQSAQEQLWSNYSTNKPLLEGVPESAAQGLATGALGGAGISTLESIKPEVPPKPSTEVPPETSTERRAADITQHAKAATDELLAAEEPVAAEAPTTAEATPTLTEEPTTAEAAPTSTEAPVAAEAPTTAEATPTSTEEPITAESLVENAPVRTYISAPETGRLPTKEEHTAHAAKNAAIGEAEAMAARWGAPVTSRLHKMLRSGALNTKQGVEILEDELQKASSIRTLRETEIAKDLDAARANLGMEPSPQKKVAPAQAVSKEDIATEELLSKEEAPASITNNLRKIAKQNGVTIEKDHTPNDVIEAIRSAYEAKKAAQPKAAPAPAPTPAPPAILTKQFSTRGAAKRAITSTKNPELSNATHEPIETEPGKWSIAPKAAATIAPAPTPAPKESSVAIALSEMRPPVKPKSRLKEVLKKIWDAPRNARNLAFDYLQVMGPQADARWVNQFRRQLVSLGLPPTVIQKLCLEASSSQTVRDNAVAGEAVIKGTMEYNEDLSKWESVYIEGENIDALYGSLIKINKHYNETQDQTRTLFNVLMEGRRILGMYEAADKIRAEAKLRGKEDGRAYLKENKHILELPEAMDMTREKAEEKANILTERPEFSEPIRIWTKIRENIIKVLVDSGRFDPVQAENYLAVAEYVPFYRLMTIDTDEALEHAFLEMSRGSAGGITKGQKLYKIKGHTERDINDILTNMEQWMANSFSMALRANKGLAIVDLALDWMPEGTIEKVGIGSEDAIRIFRNGQNEYYKFADPLMRFALNSIPTCTYPAVRFIAQFTNFLRGSILLDPIFTIAQIPQDTVEAMFSSGVKNPLMLIPSVISEFAKSLTPGLAPSVAHKELQKLGIVGERDFQAPTHTHALDINVGLSRKAPIKGSFNKMKDAMHTFSMKGDNAMRQAVYTRTLKETGDKALAAERASEIMNFRRRGASATIDILRQTVPFFGASMQVLNVALKTVSGTGVAPIKRAQAFKTLASTYTTYLALSFLYSWLKSDDDDYQNLDTLTKNTHLIYMGTDQPLMIPIRQSIYTLPFVVANTAWDTLLNKGTEDPKAARKSISDALMSVIFSTPFGVGLIKPPMEVAINHDFFTGRDIVGGGLENLEASEQYTPTTSELAKLIGSTGAISPVNVDHLLRGWMGYVGSSLMTLSNVAAAEGFNVPLPAKTSTDWVRDIPGMHAFIGKEMPAGKLNKFYEMQKDVETAVKTYKRLSKEDAAKADAYSEKNQFLLAPGISKALNKIQAKLSKIREAENEIYRLPYTEMSAEEKRLELKQLALDKNEVVSDIIEIRRAAQGFE